MSDEHNDLQEAKALVIDGNPQSRSIIVSQLRDASVGTIVQCARLVDARSKLEMGSYDVVICEQYFEREDTTGQDLLDDLRRNQLLPFYTVFVMVTSEASYSKVAEAAESALDAYLLKPHTAAGLVRAHPAGARTQGRAERHLRRHRRATVRRKPPRCARPTSNLRKPYWLYAARIGAELMLRNGQRGEAEKLYEAVVQAKTLPWAKLGVARAQLEAGYPASAPRPRWRA